MKKIKDIVLILFIIVITFLIWSNYNHSDQQNSPISNDSCIPPLEGDIAYSSSLNPTQLIPGKDLIVAPPLPWEMVSPLPERWLGWGEPFSRSINEHTEIWILSSADWDKNPDDAARKFSFLIYRPDTGEWKKVSAVISDSNVSVRKLFTAPDGSLWGASGGINMLPSAEAKSPLAKYNEQTEKFEFVEEASEIPAGRIEPNGFLAFPSYWSVTLQDKDGAFWVFAHKNGIYRFDSFTYQSQKYADTPNTVFDDVAISSAGDIYYYDIGVDLNFSHIMSDLNIYRFDTKSKITEKIGINLKPWPNYFVGMIVDQKDRLWLGGVGFREPDGDWYQIHESPVFVLNKLEDHITKRWQSPMLLMESSDNRLWFQSSNGTTWLDLEKGKWCWFTTYQANIVEDSDRNLWMIAGGKLYKNVLGE